jgi:hypothetical protein
MALSPNKSKQENNIEEKDVYVRMPLAKINFILMAIAGIMIVVGFLLMLGSSSTPEEFNPDIFSTRRIIVGPTIAFLGFLFMGFGIIYRSKKDK